MITLLFISLLLPPFLSFLLFPTLLFFISPRIIFNRFLLSSIFILLLLSLLNKFYFGFSTSSDLIFVNTSYRNLFSAPLSLLRFLFLSSLLVGFYSPNNKHLLNSFVSKKIFKGLLYFLIINSIIIVLCNFSTPLRLFLYSLHESVLLHRLDFEGSIYTKSLGLLPGFEFNALFSICLACIGYSISNPILIVLGLISSFFTGKFGIIQSSLFLIVIFSRFYFNTFLKPFTNHCFYAPKLNPKFIFKISFPFIVLFLAYFSSNYFILSVFGSRLSLVSLTELFLYGTYDGLSSYSTTGLAAYDSISAYFPTQFLESQFLLIGSPISTIEFLSTDSGVIRTIASGGIFYLFFVVLLLFYLSYLSLSSMYIRLSKSSYFSKYLIVRPFFSYKLFFFFYIFINLKSLSFFSISSFSLFILFSMSLPFLLSPSSFSYPRSTVPAKTNFYE